MKTSCLLASSSKVVTFVPTKNAEQARLFYEDTLGLTFQSDDAFALVFEQNGTMLRVVRVGNFTPAPFTVLGWDVENIVAAAADLRDRGVAFQKFPGLDQDEAGIWTAPNAARVAWFLDPDGNVLSISQGPSL